MSFVFGANHSSGKTSGTSDYTKSGTTTTTPTLPDWLSSTLQKATGKAFDLSGVDPTTYIAGPNALLTGAGDLAGGLTGHPDVLGAANNITGYVANANAPRTEAVKAAPGIQTYMDPYLESVVGNTLKDFDFNAGQTRAQQDLDLAGSGAFGGSGAALTKSGTEDALARARATTDSTLRSQGFGQALAAAQADAARKQGANDLNANLYAGQMDRAVNAAGQSITNANSTDANTRANAGAMTAAGAPLQDIAQKIAAAPLDLQSWLKDNLSPLLQGLFGQTEVADETGTEKSTGKSSGTTFGVSVSGGGK